MKKRWVTLALSLVLALSSSVAAFAGTWEPVGSDWKYKNDDGSYSVNGWQWIDGNNDGTAECYYFDANGYMLANTTTPDGYQVNSDGAWVELGMVRTQPVANTNPIEATNTGDTSIPSGYNEDGISNIVIDMLEHTRTENAKYGESSTMELGGNIRVFYDNYGLQAEYNGLSENENKKPSFVFSTTADDVFKNAPMTGNAESDYNELKSQGYDITTNGGSVTVLCGKYGIGLRNGNAEAYIIFDYR